MIFMSTLRDLLRQMKSLGKLIVEEDINKLSFSGVQSWHYGFALWYASELLSLIDFFFPLDKEIEKRILQQKIAELEQKQKEGMNKKNAEQGMAQNFKRSVIRRNRRGYPRFYGQTRQMVW